MTVNFSFFKFASFFNLVSSSQLIPIDPTMIKTPGDVLSEELTSRCHVHYVTQIRLATMVRVAFDKSLRSNFFAHKEWIR